MWPRATPAGVWRAISINCLFIYYTSAHQLPEAIASYEIEPPLPESRNSARNGGKLRAYVGNSVTCPAPSRACS